MADLSADWTALRDQRNALLSACDWRVHLDSPLEKCERWEWTLYRQALRDLPETTADPANPAWPTPPGGAQ